MRYALLLAISCLLIACGDMPPTATPIVIVVTATPKLATPTIALLSSTPHASNTPDTAGTQQTFRLATVAAINTQRAAEGAAIHATETELVRPTNTRPPPTSTPLPPPLNKSSIDTNRVQIGYQDIDFAANILEDRFTFTIEYQNYLARAVQIFRGTLDLYDPFGAKLKSLTITVSEPVAARSSVIWKGTAHYNQFIEDDVQLRQYVLSGTAKYQWSLTAVIYSDGTEEDVP